MINVHVIGQMGDIMGQMQYAMGQMQYVMGQIQYVMEKDVMKCTAFRFALYCFSSKSEKGTCSSVST